MASDYSCRTVLNSPLVYAKFHFPRNTPKPEARVQLGKPRVDKLLKLTIRRNLFCILKNLVPSVYVYHVENWGRENMTARQEKYLDAGERT